MLRAGPRAHALHYAAPMSDPSLDDVAVFVRVVERGGFAAAARELGAPTSTLSRAVARLEAQTGVRLLHRSTRSVLPTAEGRELFASVSPAVATIRGAARALEPATRSAKGRVRVSAPNDLAAAFLADVIVDFLDAHPRVQLDFALTNRHSKLIEEGFDVAVRATARLGDSSLVARKLGDVEQRLYASPAYLERAGIPASLDDLQSHRCVVFRAPELARTWTLRGPTGDVEAQVRGRVGGDDFAFVRSIVLAGGGVGLLPQINCAAYEASGALVRVLPDLHARGASLYLVYPYRRHVPARVTAFRDFVVAAFARWSGAAAQGKANERAES